MLVLNHDKFNNIIKIISHSELKEDSKDLLMNYLDTAVYIL